MKTKTTRLELLEVRYHSERLEGSTPQEIISWALEHCGAGLCMGTSFGVSGMALMDLALEACPELDIFYVDTGKFFDETYKLIEKVETHYGRSLRRVLPELNLEAQSQKHGDELWLRNPDSCCELRKVRPLRAALSGCSGWMTAIRRDQSPSRSQTPVVTWNRSFGALKVAPLINWSETDVWSYVLDRGIPYNELHNRGYTSIGCAPCTVSTKDGQDLRAGRWGGRSKTECGIHLAS